MRKRTISRFSIIVACCAALAVGSSAVEAQEPQPVSQVPDLHVVVKGETLWDLASRYFGDPLLWPEIYRLNTTVVEDPHWIFPGEELRLAGMAVAQAGMEGMEGRAEVIEPGVEGMPEGPPVQRVAEGEVPEAPLPPPVAPPPPQSSNVPTIFSRAAAQSSVLGIERMERRAVRQFEFYSAGFLTEDQELPWGSVLGAVGEEKLRRLPSTTFATVYDYISILPPTGGTYRVGDSLLVGSLVRPVPGWGQIFRPSGVVRVTEVGADGAIAQVMGQFHRISDGQLALPLEPFSDPGGVMPVPIENGMMGAIITPRGENPVPSQLQHVFINLGRNAGVAPGDLFAVLKMDKGEGLDPRKVAYLRIVHVRDESATGLITNVMDLGTADGAPVQLIRKMPS